MTTLIYAPEVKRPTTTPIKSSILDHVAAAGNLHESDRFGYRNESGMWNSYNCLDTLVPTELCPDPTEDYFAFDTVPWVPGFSFAVYGGVQCNAVGLDREDQQAELERIFRISEGRGVEQALLTNRFIASGARTGMSGEDVAWDGPVNVTPSGTAINLQVALALLEGYAANHYSGVPTIHMPRAAASLLGADKILWEGDLAYTRLGSKVAIGGGYDVSEVDGTWDLYATGEVVIERSETVSVSSFVTPGDGSGTGSDDNDLSHNTSIALVERAYRVAVDCFVAKCTGTVTTLSGGGSNGVGFGN